MKQSDWWLAVVHCLGVAKIAHGFIGPSIRTFFPAGVRKQPLSGALCQYKDTNSEHAVPAGDADVSDKWNYMARTTKIAKYGAQENWMAILALFQNEGKYFSNINFSTAISKLAKIRSLKKQDTLFLQLLEATEANLQDPDEDPRSYATVDCRSRAR
jgi:hypothetical protein